MRLTGGRGYAELDDKARNNSKERGVVEVHVLEEGVESVGGVRGPGAID